MKTSNKNDILNKEDFLKFEKLFQANNEEKDDDAEIGDEGKVPSSFRTKYNFFASNNDKKEFFWSHDLSERIIVFEEFYLKLNKENIKEKDLDESQRKISLEISSSNSSSNEKKFEIDKIELSDGKLKKKK